MPPAVRNDVALISIFYAETIAVNVSRTNLDAYWKSKLIFFVVDPKVHRTSFHSICDPISNRAEYELRFVVCICSRAIEFLDDARKIEASTKTNTFLPYKCKRSLFVAHTHCRTAYMRASTERQRDHSIAREYKVIKIFDRTSNELSLAWWPRQLCAMYVK